MSLEEAANRRGVCKRRISQQAKEGGWGIRKVSRGRYALSEGGKMQGEPKNRIDTPDERKAYETILRSDLEQAEDFQSRSMTICMLAEMEFDRVGPKRKGPDFNDGDDVLSEEQIDWLLHSTCYQVGLISSEDLGAMSESLKKIYEYLKTKGEVSEMTFEDSAWRFMALNSILALFEARERRGDQRVVIANNTGLTRKLLKNSE